MTDRTVPVQELNARLRQRQQRIRELEARDRRLSLARGATLLVGAVMAWASFDPERLGTGWLLVPIAAFATLVWTHDRVLRGLREARRRAAFCEAALARAQDRWAGLGPDGREMVHEEHPYAADLDLFGEGSLFELLCAARTSAGRRTLGRWLLHPASPREIRERQGAVRELSSDLDLREALALAGDDVAEHWHPDDLASWARGTAVDSPAWARWGLPLVVLAFWVTLAGWLTGSMHRFAFLAAFLLQAGVALALRARVEHVVAAIGPAVRELDLLAGVLRTFESRRFTDPWLQQRVQALRSGGVLPSQQVARLDRLVVLLDSRRNTFFAPLALSLMWTTQLALAIERWRQQQGSHVRGWLDAVGDLEALCSLSGYAHGHPGDVFPEIGGEGPVFRAAALGHPLLPADTCVPNDVALGAERRLWIVSGSNMSGKSTLMRAVGVAAVMAQAGAPVRARSLTMSSLQPGGSIRLQDSLRKGMSGFYAEIHRLRQLVELAAGERPLLFLLEEILSTTNSHDRRIGARAVLAALLRHGAAGLVTTHDLELTRLAEELPGAINVHFADQVVDGEIRFDYRLRPGVVDRSNAVALMRSIGLEV